MKNVEQYLVETDSLQFYYAKHNSKYKQYQHILQLLQPNLFCPIFLSRGNYHQWHLKNVSKEILSPSVTPWTLHV